jgi:hypothetical protein
MDTYSDDYLTQLRSITLEILNNNCLNKDTKGVRKWEPYHLDDSYDDLHSCYYTNDGYGSAEVFDLCSSCTEILKSYTTQYNNYREACAFQDSKIGRICAQLCNRIVSLEAEVTELKRVIEQLKLTGNSTITV